MNLGLNKKLSLVSLALMGVFSSAVNAQLSVAPSAGRHVNEVINNKYSAYTVRPLGELSTTSTNYNIEDDTSFLYDDIAKALNGKSLDEVFSDNKGFRFLTITDREKTGLNTPDIITIGNNFSYEWNINLAGSKLTKANQGRFYALGGSGSSTRGPVADITIGDNLYIKNQDAIGFETALVNLTIGKNAQLLTEGEALIIGQEIGNPVMISRVRVGEGLTLTGGYGSGAVLAQYGVDIDFSANSKFHFYESAAWETANLQAATQLVGLRVNGGDTSISVVDSEITSDVKNASIVAFYLGNGAYGNVDGAVPDAASFSAEYANVGNEILVTNTSIDVTKNDVGSGVFTLARMGSLEAETAGLHQDSYLRLDHVNVSSAAGGKAFDLIFDKQDNATTENNLFIDIISSDLSDLTGGINGSNANGDDSHVAFAKFNLADSQISGGVNNNSSDKIILDIGAGSTLEGGLNNLGTGSIDANLSGQSTLTGGITNASSGTVNLNAADSTVTGDIVNQADGTITTNLTNSQLTGDVTNTGSGTITGGFDAGSSLTGSVNNLANGEIDLGFKNGSTLTGNASNDADGTLSLSFDTGSNLVGDATNKASGTLNLDVTGGSTATGNFTNELDGVLNLNVTGESVLAGDITNSANGTINGLFDGNSQYTGNVANLDTGSINLSLDNGSTGVGDIQNAAGGTVGLILDNNSTWTGAFDNSGEFDLSISNGSLWTNTGKGDTTLSDVTLNNGTIDMGRPADPSEAGRNLSVNSWDSTDGKLILYAGKDSGNNALLDKLVVGNTPISEDSTTTIEVVDLVGDVISPDQDGEGSAPVIISPNPVNPGNVGGVFTTGLYQYDVDIDASGSFTINHQSRRVSPVGEMYNAAVVGMTNGMTSPAVGALGNFQSYFSNAQVGCGGRVSFADISYGRGDIRAKGNGSTLDTDQTQIVVGSDVYAKDINGACVTAGVLFAHSLTNSDLDTRHYGDIGRNRQEGNAVSVYGRFEFKDNLYANIAGMSYFGDIESRLNGVSSVSAGADALALSLELGKRFALTPNWTLQPSVQSIFQRSSFDDRIDHINRTELDNVSTQYYRVGTSLHYKGEWKSTPISASLDANLWHQASGDSHLRSYSLANQQFNGELTNSQDNTWGEVGAKLKAQVGKQTSVEASLGYRGKFERKDGLFAAQVGLTYRW